MGWDHGSVRTVDLVVVAADGAHDVVEWATGVALTHHCPRCGATDHGRPMAPGSSRHVSLARSGPLAVVALADVPVGVDVERTGAVDVAALRAVGLEDDDPTRAWVRAEARGKLTGEGLSGRGHHDPRAVVTDVHVGHGLVVAVATWEPVRVRTDRAAGRAAPADAATGPASRSRRGRSAR